MSEGSRSNNDAYKGLSSFVGCCRISVRRCMLRGDNNISQGSVAGSPVFPHPISLVELRSQIIMISEMWGILMNFVKKCLCMLIIYICKNSSERHMVGFLGEFLCTSSCGCIYICITVWDCRWNWVIWGRLLGWCVVIYRETRVICNHPVICVRKNKTYEYGKTRVIWDHLVIHFHTNKRYG